MMHTSQRSTQDILSDVGDLASELYTKLDVGRQLQEHPYRTLAIAAGAGYLLGGGLFTRMTGSLLRVGVRAMAIPAFQNVLAQSMTHEGLEPDV